MAPEWTPFKSALILPAARGSRPILTENGKLFCFAHGRYPSERALYASKTRTSNELWGRDGRDFNPAKRVSYRTFFVRFLALAVTRKEIRHRAPPQLWRRRANL